VRFLSDDVLAHVRGALDEPDLDGTKYRLVKPLGRGGMASVFEAVDTELSRSVALKVSSLAQADDMAERIVREARVVAGLEHPGIVPVHDVGQLPDGRVFYAMKLVRGETLDAWVRGTDARASAVLRVFQRICEAVAFAHARGVIHRDLKPTNLMIGEFGEALVMDWGVARELTGDCEPNGAIAGTPAFMAPEQASGTAEVDARADVYGLGATLASVIDELPTPLAAIVAKAKAARPDDRYPSARELADELGRFLDGERVHAHRESIPERAARFAARHRVALLLFAVYVVVRVVLALFAR
jgi:eukaryotic-like serine/threonine-protein kinase